MKIGYLFIGLLVLSVVLSGCATQEAAMPAPEQPVGQNEQPAASEQTVDTAINDAVASDDDTVELGELV